MRISAFIGFVLAAALLPTATHAAPKASGPELAIFCEGTYALCIKAPCVPVANASGIVTSVVCSCVVEQGVSMGPAPCSQRRAQKKVGGITHLMSTYSNYFNTEEQTLTCSRSNQKWANCYGAPCVSDATDPARAHCNCPVWTGEMLTLGGKCAKDSCNAMWSAATPKQNAFANNHFYNYVKDNYPSYPTKPPAKVCGAI